MILKHREFNLLYKVQNLSANYNKRFVPAIYLKSNLRAKKIFFLEFLGRLQGRFKKSRKNFMRGRSIQFYKYYLLFYKFLNCRFRWIIYQWIYCFNFHTIISNFDNFNLSKFVSGRNMWLDENKFFKFAGVFYLGRQNNFNHLQTFWFNYPMLFYTFEGDESDSEEEDINHDIPHYYNGTVVYNNNNLIDLIDLIFFLEIINTIEFLGKVVEENYYYIAERRLNIYKNMFSNWLFYTAINRWRVRQMASILGMWPYLRFIQITGRRLYLVAPVMRTYMGVQKEMIDQFHTFVLFEIYLRLAKGWRRKEGYSIHGQRTRTNNKTAKQIFKRKQNYGSSKV